MISKLKEAIRQKQAPIVVGLDPQLKLLPPFLMEESMKTCGETLEAAAEAVLKFNRALIDAIQDLVPAVKPQIAMYEQFGIPGLAAFQKTVTYAKKKGLLVIGDIKRGDIGSTSTAYAVGHIGKVQVGSKTFYPFDEDFVTVNPYLGSDGVRPFIDVCNQEDRGIFVLVKTSNPSSGEFQDQEVDGKPLYELVAAKVAEWAKLSMDGEDSNVGAVVGATYPEIGKRLRKEMPESFILVPGYGAQGGKGKDLTGFFRKDGTGAIINSSRGIIAAWQNDRYQQFGAEGFAEAARAAVLDMKQDIEEALNA